MGVATLTAALALLLLLYIPGGEAQNTCHTSSDCSDSGTSVSSHQECCLQSGTMAYNDGACQECVVLGWWQAVQDDGSITMNPSFTAKETTPFYNFDIGYIKGTTGFASLTPSATFGVTDGSVAADSDDVNLEIRQHFVSGTMNGSVGLQLRVDQLAMEPEEQFTVGLTSGFGVTADVVFIQNMVVTIIDNDNVTIQFTERDYTRGEDDETSQIPVAVVRTSDYGSRLANPIEFRVVPLTYQQVEENNMTELPPELELEDDIYAPVFATANDDFNSTVITGTFSQNDDVREQIDTPIPFTNDDIDEVDQFFVVKLELVSATNPDRVTIGRTFSQCIIEDEDSLMLSFERLERTENENATFIFVRIKKEPRPDGTPAETEITYLVSIQTSSSGAEREATEEEDFSIGATPLDFGIGEIRRRFFPEDLYLNLGVDITDDNIPEGSESFKLVLSPIAGEPQFAPTPLKSETIVTIIDNDDLRFGFVEIENVVVEGETFLVQVRLYDVEDHEMLPPELMVRLRVQTVAGTAGGGDYVEIVGLLPSDNPLLINPFQDNHRIQDYNIVIEDDNSFEEDETFTLTLTDYPNTMSDAILRPDLYTVTIVDTDTVTIGFERITYDVSEGDGTIWIKVVVLNGTIGIPSITLSVSTTDGSADGSDYSQLSNFQFDMLSGETSFIIDINITDDTLIETIETFTARLSLVSPLSPQSLSDRIIISPNLTTISIADNDVRIGFEQTAYPTSEAMGFVEVCAVVEAGAVLDSITLPVQATNITAEYIIDYTPDSFDFNFSPGDMKVCYNMTIVADVITEVAESFLLTMSSPYPNVLIGVGTATVNIAPDQEVIVRFGQSLYQYNESDVTGRVEVQKIGNIIGSLTVQVTVSLRSSANIVQSVSTSSSISVTFQENENSQFISFFITNDAVALEDIEIHDFTLEDPTDPRVILGSPDQCQVEIIDDDTVSVRFGNTVYTYGEDAGSGTVDVIRTGATVRSFTVDVTSVLRSSVNIVQSGNIASLTALSFGTAASETEVITFTITDDDVALEPVEIHDLTLIDPPDTRIEIGTPGQCQVEIVDEDEVTLTFKEPRYTTTEEEGSVEVCVEKDRPIIQSFTFTLTTTAGTALDGPDYVGFTMRTVTFPVGTDEVCVTIDIVNDVETETNVEGEETFTVSIDPLLPPGVIVGDPGVTTVVIGPDPVQVTYVNDTIVGDPLFHVPIKSGNSPLADVGLCYEIHGENDKYFNLVSDTCTSVNAHWTNVTSSLNVINIVAIRTVDNDGNCVEITISLMGWSECYAEVNGVRVETSYENAGILMRKSSRLDRWKVIVPNCNDVRLEMWITCHANMILDPATNSEIQADMMKVVVQRGLNAGRMAHGLIGQFWNQEVSVQSYTGPVHESVSNNSHYRITMPNQRSFTAIHHDVNWIWEKINCLYAGNHQGGPIYEVQDPNDPVIAGEYTNYIVPGPFSEQGYMYGLFDETQCST